jgi:hypothetical protein
MYYILQESPLDDLTDLTALTDYGDAHVDGANWYEGAQFTVPIPQPIRLSLDPSVPGELPLFFSFTIPLMHDKLILALRDAGVDNLDLFDAVVTHEPSGHQYHEYKAVNVIGVVAAADLSASDYESYQPTPLISVNFNSLVIDESKAHGLLMFRLAECVSAIVIHQKVKDLLDERDLFVGCIEPKDFVS